MTYSICVSNGEKHGIAIATKAPTVGSLAPFLSYNGAVSTQSFVSIPIGVKVARLMNEGAGIDAAVETLIERDEHASLRQVHGIDRWGNTVTFTGDDCVDWYGSRVTDEYTIAGNMLVGEEVLQAVGDSYDENDELSMAERLLEALQAGEDAGGDKRAGNAQSAALKVYDPEEPRLRHDLRVDDHDDPVSELRRLFAVAAEADEQWQEEFPEADLQRTPR